MSLRPLKNSTEAIFTVTAVGRHTTTWKNTTLSWFLACIIEQLLLLVRHRCENCESTWIAWFTAHKTTTAKQTFSESKIFFKKKKNTIVNGFIVLLVTLLFYPNICHLCTVPSSDIFRFWDRPRKWGTQFCCSPILQWRRRNILKL